MGTEYSEGAGRKRAIRGMAGLSALFAVILLLYGCAPTLQTVRETNDQDKLVKIATEAENAAVRRAAVGRLTDQAVLLKIVATDQDAQVRLAAAGKITDQPVVAKLAATAPDAAVRRVAVAKLADLSLLMKILAADEVTSVRLAALVKINDQAVLAELATTDRNGDVRCAAVTRLTDQAVLAKLAATDEIWDVRLLAVKKLAEQQLLAALAVDGKYSDVRQAAVERLTDQDLLVRIAVHNKNPDTQRAALEKITGQAEVAGIVLASPEFNSLVREAPKLTARNLLARVPVILEKALWAKAEADGRDAGLYREYLNRFPQTAHSAAAQDCVDWAAAEACGLTAVQTYLAAHPQGRFAARGREYLQAAGEIDAWTQELLDKQAWEMVKPQLKGSHGSQPSWVYGWISSGSTRLVYRGATSKDGRMKVLLDDNSRLAALGRVYEYCDGKWFPAKERVFQTKKEQ